MTGALVDLGAERRRQWNEPVGERLTHVQERRATRSSEELPGRSERDVAADRLHVDRHLPDGLGDVERVDGATAREHLPTSGRIGQRAHMRGHVGHEHEPHTIVDQVVESLEIDRPVRQRSDLDDVDAVCQREAAEPGIHRGVGEPIEEDAVARVPAERLGHRPQRPLPRSGGALGDGDFGGAGAEQPGDALRDGGELGLDGLGCLVTADLLLELEVLEHAANAGVGVVDMPAWLKWARIKLGAPGRGRTRAGTPTRTRLPHRESNSAPSRPRARGRLGPR